MDQTWDANPIHDSGNIAADLGGVFAGPPGDPGQIRQSAQRIEHLAWEYQQHAAAINHAVDTLRRCGLATAPRLSAACGTRGCDDSRQRGAAGR